MANGTATLPKPAQASAPGTVLKVYGAPQPAPASAGAPKARQQAIPSSPKAANQTGYSQLSSMEPARSNGSWSNLGNFFYSSVVKDWRGWCRVIQLAPTAATIFELAMALVKNQAEKEDARLSWRDVFHLVDSKIEAERKELKILRLERRTGINSDSPGIIGGLKESLEHEKGFHWRALRRFGYAAVYFMRKWSETNCRRPKSFDLWTRYLGLIMTGSGVTRDVRLACQFLIGRYNFKSLQEIKAQITELPVSNPPRRAELEAATKMLVRAVQMEKDPKKAGQMVKDLAAHHINYSDLTNIELLSEASRKEKYEGEYASKVCLTAKQLAFLKLPVKPALWKQVDVSVYALLMMVCLARKANPEWEKKPEVKPSGRQPLDWRQLAQDMVILHDTLGVIAPQIGDPNPLVAPSRDSASSL